MGGVPVSFVANFGENQDLFGQIRQKIAFLGIYRLHTTLKIRLFGEKCHFWQRPLQISESLGGGYHISGRMM